MPMRGERTHWGHGSIALHWLTFVLVLGAAALGLTMDELPRGVLKLQAYALHKSLGVTVLGLTALRLLWRLLAGAPSALDGTPRWQSRLAGATHVALYVLLLAVPLSGWRYNALSGFPLQWFGLWRLPAIAATDLAAKHDAEALHEWLFYILAGVVFVHAIAALGHHYYWRDDTLRRMWFRRRARTPQVAPPPSVQDFPR